MAKRYGIYEVSESFREDGLWQGYTVRCVAESGKKQGKLYIKTDGTENYREKPKDEDIEI